MSLQIAYYKHTLNFRFEAGTSRGVLRKKDSFFIKIWNKGDENIFGIGEAAPLFGLSPEFYELESRIIELVKEVNYQQFNTTQFLALIVSNCQNYPSLIFAIETAIKDLENGGIRMIFKNNFVKSHIKKKINGLIWMGNEAFMKSQLDAKIKAGFSCIKVKIGALNHDIEIDFLKRLRREYPEIELRLDANGAYTAENAERILNDLAVFKIHSIEQPIPAGNLKEMARLCKNSPIPIALDEELIGVKDFTILNEIKPQYIILKPSLVGGFENSNKWIVAAERSNINWWFTSALESNVGLNAICQFSEEYKNDLPQGFGTGGLYENNIDSPLCIEKDEIYYNSNGKWDLSLLKF